MLRVHFGWLAIAVSLIASGTVVAQVGKDTTLWQFTEIASHHEPIVQVNCNGGTGTGVIISVDKDKPFKEGFQGYCLTAWHVVEGEKDKTEITIQYRNGKKSRKCQVVQHDEQSDVALVWVWVPEGVEPAKIANKCVQQGDKLEMAGLGGGSELSCCLRHFSAVASMPSSAQKIFADVPLLPGDSGGPVFNEANEVVGIISGGWFWWDGGVVTQSGNKLNATWPARASNLDPIHAIMANVESTATLIR